MTNIMSRLRYLSFEINNECPLESYHPQCPRNAKDRYAKSMNSEPITIDDIIGFYSHCVEHHGFRGMMNFHNYNEPLTAKNQIIEIMRILPESKFSIWTNGVFLDADPVCEWIISRCDEVMVTIYPETNTEAVLMLCGQYKQMKTQPGILDDRILENIETEYHVGITHCDRPNFDLIIDYYGNGHVCCSDWRGEIEIGNIKIESYEAFLKKWDAIRNRLSRLIDETVYRELPRVCKWCFARTPFMQRIF